VVSLLVTSVLETISGAWAFIIEAGAGLGLVLILRWYWWRINAWSEIAAMLTPVAAYGAVRLWTTLEFPVTLYLIVGVTTVVWLLVTFATPPTDEATLAGFYRRVHPGGPGWRRVARGLGMASEREGLARMALAWCAGVVLVYASLFGVGRLLFGELLEGFLFLVLAAGAGAAIARILSRTEFERILR
jgi:SSS family solute:Na+ symporter